MFRNSLLGGLLGAGLLLGLLLPAAPLSAQKPRFPEVAPGHTFPKEGVTPNPQSVVFILYWHHKKRVDEFGFQDYFQGADEVNRNSAEWIRKAMEKRYPNLLVLVAETNERDVKDRVEQLKKQKRTPQQDYVDVKQPDKIEPPKRVGPRDYSYDGGITKIGPEIITPPLPPEFAVVEKVQPNGGVIVKNVRATTINKIMVVTVIRDGKQVTETRNVPFQTPSTFQTSFNLHEEAGLDASGKKLSKSDVLARLKPGQTILITSDPKGVDPAYLAVLKPDTIILWSRPR